jgi:hypothetical protein
LVGLLFQQILNFPFFPPITFFIIIYIRQCVNNYFYTLARIAYNVLAVYDENGGTKGLAKQDRRRFCGGEKCHKGTTCRLAFFAA